MPAFLNVAGEVSLAPAHSPAASEREEKLRFKLDFWSLIRRAPIWRGTGTEHKGEGGWARIQSGADKVGAAQLLQLDARGRKDKNDSLLFPVAQCSKEQQKYRSHDRGPNENPRGRLEFFRDSFQFFLFDFGLFESTKTDRKWYLAALKLRTHACPGPRGDRGVTQITSDALAALMPLIDLKLLEVDYLLLGFLKVSLS
jgi:hypothetical protein